MSVCAMPIVAAKSRGERPNNSNHHHRHRRALEVHGTLTALFAGDDRHCADRHQESFGLLHRVAAWLYVHGVRRGAFSAGIFHLMTHAFFKGLLFLAAGSVIHGVGGEQDMP